MIINHDHDEQITSSQNQPCSNTEMSRFPPNRDSYNGNRSSSGHHIRRGVQASSDLPSDVESDCPVPVSSRSQFFIPRLGYTEPSQFVSNSHFPSPFQSQRPLDDDPQLQHQALNKPIYEESERLRTFSTWSNRNVTAEELARDGFTYTGVRDRVQCTFCKCVLSGWDAGDVVADEHRRHFPKCPFVNDLPVGNIPIPLQHVQTSNNFSFVPPQSNSAALDIPPQVPTSLTQNHVRHPEYAIEAHRLSSYHNWPAQLSQKPADLAKAGLFYEGTSDRCKCFQCGGVLHDWETEDDPWVEHARWFQHCAFVKMAKGEEFIRRAVSGEGYIPQAANSISSSGDTSNSGDIWCQPAVQAVLQNGYSRELVQRAIQRHGPNFKDTQELFHAVIAAEQEEKMQNCREESGMEVEETTPKVTDLTQPKASCSADREKMGDNKKDRHKSSDKSSKKADSSSSAKTDDDDHTCKICLDEEISVVFVPCGHLCCCASCAAPLNECPICRAPIEKKVKTYWA